MSSELYEIQVEREDGFRVHGAAVVATWQAWRVKYRRVGSHGRWTAFVTDAHLGQFGVAELQSLCQLHDDWMSS